MFRDVLETLLKTNGCSANQMAREIGVPKSMAYEWKSGVREPSAENLRKIAEYFHVSIAYLLEQQDETPPDPAERELILMLREAKKLSPREHDELVANFRQNLDLYLRAKGADKPDKP